MNLEVDYTKLTIKQLQTIINKLFEIMTLDENIINKFDFIDSIPYIHYGNIYEIIELQQKIDILKKYYPYKLPENIEDCQLVIDIIMAVIDCDMEHIKTLNKQILDEIAMDKENRIEKQSEYSFIENMFDAKSNYLYDFDMYNELFPSGIKFIFNKRVMAEIYSLQEYSKLKIYDDAYIKLIDEGKYILRLWNNIKFDKINTFELFVLVDKLSHYVSMY